MIMKRPLQNGGLAQIEKIKEDLYIGTISLGAFVVKEHQFKAPSNRAARNYFQSWLNINFPKT